MEDEAVQVHIAGGLQAQKTAPVADGASSSYQLNSNTQYAALFVLEFPFINCKINAGQGVEGGVFFFFAPKVVVPRKEIKEAWISKYLDTDFFFEGEGEPPENVLVKLWPTYRIIWHIKTMGGKGLLI